MKRCEPHHVVLKKYGNEKICRSVVIYLCPNVTHFSLIFLKGNKSEIMPPEIMPSAIMLSYYVPDFYQIIVLGVIIVSVKTCRLTKLKIDVG